MTTFGAFHEKRKQTVTRQGRINRWGASGIGLCCARRYADEDAKVVITDRDVPAGRIAKREIGENIRFLPQDVTDEHQWDGIVQNTIDTFGAFDILVNCAGVFRRGNIEDTSISLWRDIMGVNLESTFSDVERLSEP